MRCVFPYDHVAAPVDPGAIVHQGCRAGNEAVRRRYDTLSPSFLFLL